MRQPYKIAIKWRGVRWVDWQETTADRAHAWAQCYIRQHSSRYNRSDWTYTITMEG